VAKKIRVGILFGGKSAEHEVSLQSAKNVIEAINKDKYEVVLIGLDKKGKWFLNDSSQFLLHSNNPKLIKLNEASDAVALIPQSSGKLSNLTNYQSDTSVDVVFPVLHGPFGEDGTVQGLLKLANLPFVGASVLGSAVGMDKDVMKRLLRDGGIPTARFITLTRSDSQQISFEDIEQQLGAPFFVKPTNLGSSIGIHKVKEKRQFQGAIRDALSYDNKILAEEYIIGRELECSVLGNEQPIASVPGEVLPKHEFYSYEAKYIDENGAKLEIPANLPSDTAKEVQTLALQAFKILCCEGMARVDFFLKNNGSLVVNEINTIPGFSKISMYPKLWEASGIPYAGLIDKLIQLAIERFKREKKLKTTY